MLTRVEWNALNDAVRNARGKTAYLEATLARYVLVDAANEDEARRLGHGALYDLYADLRERLGKEVPISIITVRPATDGAIRFWHHPTVAREHTAANGQR